MRLFARLLFFCVVPVAFAGLGVVAYTHHTVLTVLLADLQVRATEQVSTAARSSRSGLKARSEAALRPLVRHVVDDYPAGATAAVVDPDGLVICHSNVVVAGSRLSDAFTLESLGQDRLLARFVWSERPVFKLSAPVVEPASGRDSEEFLLGGTVRRPTRRLGAFIFEVPLQDLLAARAAISLRVFLFAGGVWVLSVILLLAVMRGVLAPIRRLAEGAESIGRGRFGTQVEASSRDELGDLARSFNRMSLDLQRTTVSKNYLNDVIQNTRDGLFVTEPEGKIVLVNAAAVALLGHSESELVGRDLRALFGVKMMPPVNDLELRLKTKQGAEIDVHFSSGPIEDSRGVTGVVCSVRDITGRKRAEAALRESEERYRALFNSGFDPVLFVDGETHRIENVNEAATELYGYTREEFLCLDIEEISAEPERTRASVDRVSAGQRGVIHPLFHKKKDGTVFPVEIAASQCVLGGRAKAVGSVRDITESKRAERALRESEERYRGLFEGELDPVVVFDAVTARIIDANAAAVAFFGYPKRELLALGFGDLSGESGCWALSDEPPVERLLRRKDGTVLPCEINKGSFQSQGRLMVIAAVRDLTQRRKAEETELLRTREQMMREMMATVSHELRTPLAAIKGYSETLRCGGLEDVENRLEFVQTIEKHAERLSLLVEDLLLISDLDSRAKKPDFESLDLARFVEAYVKSLAPVLEGGRPPLRLEVAPGLRVRADAERLTRVFQNLLDNAFKYSRPGGSVSVSARADGTGALVTVRDTGRGIPEVELDLVFGRFYRSSLTRDIRGTGLGLSIVKAIVELHGGRVWAESVVGKGAAFHFTLPLAG